MDPRNYATLHLEVLKRNYEFILKVQQEFEQTDVQYFYDEPPRDWNDLTNKAITFMVCDMFHHLNSKRMDEATGLVLCHMGIYQEDMEMCCSSFRNMKSKRFAEYQAAYDSFWLRNGMLYTVFADEDGERMYCCVRDSILTLLLQAVDAVITNTDIKISRDKAKKWINALDKKLEPSALVSPERRKLIKEVEELAEVLGPVPGLPSGFPDKMSDEEMKDWLMCWNEFDPLGDLD